jgi:hypothetical protein
MRYFIDTEAVDGIARVLAAYLPLPPEGEA